MVRHDLAVVLLLVAQYPLGLERVGVVADNVDHLTTPQPPQVVQMGEKQVGVATLIRLSLGQDHLPRPLVEQPGHVPILVIARCGHCSLLAQHPHRADLGVGFDLHFILEHHHFIGR
jgi:hypothetical protein